ncbi:hypothetical protein LTR78_007301 [Recurvomyces mirabilis]|uniref:DUF7357 domain-containing protein n=1 Tax=Recurvomyces mirabilis TaxID=574656 RepID=A0AAE0TUB8_9PEZI|nr:hypothetical protein LTR78_007301 [Recurvomyces mirabilis]KAK5155110.1 hypothetical protein LTS14_006065 [Recurvomyces mirabilis]
MRGMRLRLRIQRNELPTISTLWPVPDIQLKHTISQLLDAVNRTFPLESDTWGLEHYVVTVAGFECLHYHELGQVCKDEDEIVIRPLMYAETRARTLTGRDQITPDGRHLCDGLPFGRPLLRGVIRPDVRIPDRKGKREEVEEMVQAGIPIGSGLPNGMGMVLTRLEDREDVNEDSEGADEDFEVQDSDDQSDAATSDESDSDESSEDESDNEHDSSSGTSDTSDSDSEEENSTSDASWHGITGATVTLSARAAASKTELGSRMQPHVNGVNSINNVTVKRKAPADDHAASTVATAKKVKIDNAPPYQGKPVTKSRNQRKRDAKHLQHLKNVGVLDPNADLKALHDYQRNDQRTIDHLDTMLEVSANGQENTEEDIATDAVEQSEAQDNQAAQVAGAAVTNKPKPSKKAEMEALRRKLLQDISTGGIDINDKCARLSAKESDDTLDRVGNENEDEVEDDEAPEQQSSKPPVDAFDDTVGETVADETSFVEAEKEKVKPPAITDMVPASVARRAKLDLAGSQRMLFGSLGVRAPQTAEERVALQKKLAEKAKQRLLLPGMTPRKIPQKRPEVLSAEAEARAQAEDENAWLSKIDLSAVECCEEGVTLSTPPFPFYQRWDPQQKKRKAKGRAAQSYAEPSKRRKRGRQQDVANGELVEIYDKYNAGAKGDALDYDDVEDEEDHEQYWEEGALLKGDAEEGSEEDDGFPPLPADLTTLTPLTEADAKTDDYIIFTELVCSALTSWQPKMLTRTAKLLGRDDESAWKLQSAQRDLGKKEYDGEGNRVYRKFEMEGLSDDEGDEDDGGERERTMMWAEMGDVKLLLRSMHGEAVVIEAQT